MYSGVVHGTVAQHSAVYTAARIYRRHAKLHTSHDRAIYRILDVQLCNAKAASTLPQQCIWLRRSCNATYDSSCISSVQRTEQQSYVECHKAFSMHCMHIQYENFSQRIATCSSSPQSQCTQKRYAHVPTALVAPMDPASAHANIISCVPTDGSLQVPAVDLPHLCNLLLPYYGSSSAIKHHSPLLQLLLVALLASVMQLTIH
eukprot:7314-Heterococcus_DN1.PRE.4